METSAKLLMRAALLPGLLALPLQTLTLPAWSQNKDSAEAVATETAAEAGADATADTAADATPETPPAAPGKGFPRYASLKKTEVNVRSGPGNQYPILWVYQRPGYPVQLLAKYDNYYKLRDVEGEEGWVYVGMVAPKPTALVGGKEPILLLKQDTPDSVAAARLAPGVIVDIRECTETGYCKVDVAGYRGWVLKKQLEMID